jgi:DNA-binding XRE family transcriptional regulator
VLYCACEFGKPNSINPNIMTKRRDRMDRTKYDYSKLLGRIKEYNYTQETLAEAIGKNKSSLNLKLNQRTNQGFTTVEIDKICEVLDIPNTEIGAYFFAR